MSSNTKTKKLILKTVSVDIGCAGRCRKPKLSKIFNPKPITTKTHCYDLYRSSSTTSSHTNPSSAATFSPTMETPVLKSYSDKISSRMVRGFGRVGGESVAVQKDSDDPYLDFRRSMLQMILEKEIYSKDDLRELLNCYLQLNLPYYHGIIVKAFTEIWNGVFSVKSCGGGGGGGGGDGWEKQQHQHLNYNHHSYHRVQQQEQDYYGYGFHMSRDF